jgi:UrcA family protein
MKILISAVALIAALPAQAAAQQPNPQVSRAEVRVPYRDLNLRSAFGIQMLDRRLTRAARAVCPQVDGTLDLASKAAARRCVAITTAGLEQQRNRALASQLAPAVLAERQR